MHACPRNVYLFSANLFFRNDFLREFGERSLLRRAFTTQMHYAENECAMPIRLHCNELRALCLTTNALCPTAEFGALLLKCVLIVYIWPEKVYF